MTTDRIIHEHLLVSQKDQRTSQSVWEPLETGRALAAAQPVRAGPGGIRGRTRPVPLRCCWAMGRVAWMLSLHCPGTQLGIHEGPFTNRELF